MLSGVDAKSGHYLSWHYLRNSISEKEKWYIVLLNKLFFFSSSVEVENNFFHRLQVSFRELIMLNHEENACADRITSHRIVLFCCYIYTFAGLLGIGSSGLVVPA